MRYWVSLVHVSAQILLTEVLVPSSLPLDLLRAHRASICRSSRYHTSVPICRMCPKPGLELPRYPLQIYTFALPSPYRVLASSLPSSEVAPHRHLPTPFSITPHRTMKLPKTKR